MLPISVRSNYSETCVREPPLRLTLNSGWCGKRCLSYKGTCHIILLAISKVALLHRFHCIIACFICRVAKLNHEQTFLFLLTKLCLNEQHNDIFSLFVNLQNNVSPFRALCQYDNKSNNLWNYRHSKNLLLIQRENNNVQGRKNNCLHHLRKCFWTKQLADILKAGWRSYYLKFNTSLSVGPAALWIASATGSLWQITETLEHPNANK